MPVDRTQAQKMRLPRSGRKQEWQRPSLSKFDVREVTQGGPDPKNNDNKNKFDFS